MTRLLRCSGEDHRAMPKKIVLATFLFYFSALAYSQTPTANPILNTPADYFKLAKQQTDIRQPGAIPFRMKATFTVTSAIGDKQTGDYSELWVSPERWRRDIVVGAYHDSSACVSGAYYHFATSDAVFAAAAEVLGNFTPYIEPVEDETHINHEWQVTTEQVGGLLLPQVSRVAADDPTGSVATKYWFTPGSGYIRGLQIGGLTVFYNNFYQELGRIVPHSVSINPATGKHSVHIDITTFQSAHAPDEDAFAIAGASSSKCVAISAIPGFLNGAAVKKGRPYYPVNAQAEGIEGVVELLVTIERDGHIKNVKTLNRVFLSLAKAAVDAVRQNVYEPYLLDGIPTRVNREVSYTFKTATIRY